VTYPDAPSSVNHLTISLGTGERSDYQEAAQGNLGS
jgi:hypothetical protein